MSNQDKIRQHKKALLVALEQTLGIVTTACKSVGVSRATFYRFCAEDDEFKKSVEDMGEIALDFAESQLLSQIKENNPTSTIFYLKTKGRKRGYIERVESTGADGGPIQTVIMSPDEYKKARQEAIELDDC